MSRNAASLPSYDDALARILEHAPVIGAERVKLDDALGRTLRQDVTSDRDQPPFDRSAMDGFAVRSDAMANQTTWPVAGTVPAGGARETFELPMPDGAVKRIATGAPLPAGADAVVPIELATVEGAGQAEQVRFLLDSAQPYQNVHRRGSDAKAGQVVLQAGLRLAPHHLGIAAAVGASELAVAMRPRVVLLTTGDEVVSPATATAALEPQQIRNANGPMLKAWLAANGADLLEHVHVVDEAEQTLAAAREALAKAQLVVTVGGVSVGQRDWLPWAWQQLGLRTILHGVAIQPGKPVLAATEGDKLIMGLPGNPVSVLATAHLFLWPLLRKMTSGNGAAAALPWRNVRLAEPIQSSAKRQVFRAARMQADGSAQPIAWHGSGDLMHTATADVWLRLPMQDETVPAGTVVPSFGDGEADMNIRVLMFASLAARLGEGELTLELAENATVADALAQLSRRYAELAPLLPRLATAVNMAYVGSAHQLADGDELALIPPVSGG